MKKQVLVLHSAGPQGPRQGSDELVARLQEALGGAYRVLYPKMPAPERPSYTAWKEALRDALAALQGEVILVGHSLGGSVLLKYLSEESWGITVAGLFLVAAPYWGREDAWKMDDFTLRADWANRLSGIPRIVLYHSEDDTVVPFRHVRYYSEQLPAAEVQILEERGHIFQAPFPELAAEIAKLL